MAFYKTDVITKGDTLQSLAFKHFQDVDAWYDIADLNNLEYPYIVQTNHEKVQNPEHLASVGDRIKIPIENEVEALAVENMTDFATSSIYDITLGMDLATKFSIEGRYDEAHVELKGNEANTDLDNVTGMDNLKQSLYLRIMTRKGTLLLHPNYGSLVPYYLGKKVSEDSLSDIVIELERAITTDTRVHEVKNIDAKIDSNGIFVALSITPIDKQEAFNLFLYRNENGEIYLQ